MKILIVSQYYFPEKFIINDLSLSLVKEGHHVEVLTALPNYPKGQFFKGYNLFSNKKEYINNILIHRARIFPRLNADKISLSINYISFVVFASIKLLFLNGKFDRIFIFAPSPITVGLVGILASYKFKAKSYIWVQDLWPESVKAAAGINNSIILSFINKITTLIYKFSDTIFIQSEAFKNYIIDQGVNEKKIIYLPNYAEDFYKPIENNHEDLFTITFAGNIGKAQNLNILIEAAKSLKSKSIIIKFIIIGEGSSYNNFKYHIKLNKLDNYFELLGYQSPKKMPEYFSKTNVLFLSLIKSKIFSYTIPSKLQTYMACKKPILASIDGVANEIITKSKCGFASGSNDVKALVNNIIKLKNSDKSDLLKMGNNSLEYYNKNFSKELVLKTLITNMSN